MHESAMDGVGGVMARRQSLVAAAALLAFAMLCVSCQGGPPATGSFERTFSVSGPIRLELNNAAGDVTIRGGADGAVHIHGDVRVSGNGFENSQQRLNEIVSNPPLEQKGDTVRIGKDLARMHNLSIAYVIEVPQSTEISTKLASGAQNISGIRGPVQAGAASGTIRANNIDRAVHLATASGAVEAENCGDELRVSTASGSVTADNVKGDVLINAMSGSIQVAKPGARVEARAASGSIDVRGANNDVKARAASGRIAVQGNPSGNSYWDLKTASGAVEIAVPSNANFHLSAGAKTGGIRTDIPIVIEEQSKRSLRAHMGDGGGRVEIQTASGTIRIRGPE